MSSAVSGGEGPPKKVKTEQIGKSPNERGDNMKIKFSGHEAKEKIRNAQSQEEDATQAAATPTTAKKRRGPARKTNVDPTAPTPAAGAANALVSGPVHGSRHVH